MPEPRQIIEVREKAQTGLALLFHGPGRRDADRHAALVWAAHSGGLGGRLFQTLRDTHALAYTVTAYAWQGRHVGGLMTYIGTSPDREDEARQRLLEEIESFGEAPPSDDEVSGAIEYLVGQAEVRRQSARAMVSEIADVWLHGTGLEELVSPGSQYRSVTPDAVLAVARSYLAGQPHAEGVVRGQPSADPGRDSVTF
ncbi:MAG: insulinase family protein [Gemmatimonadales bacterium]|nr:MAG: insulinase family protein [Gemmatimonadales bacterium]